MWERRTKVFANFIFLLQDLYCKHVGVNKKKAVTHTDFSGIQSRYLPTQDQFIFKEHVYSRILSTQNLVLRWVENRSFRVVQKYHIRTKNTLKYRNKFTTSSYVIIHLWLILPSLWCNYITNIIHNLMNLL